MVPQISKEAPKTSEGIPVSLLVAIQETQDNTKYRGSRNRTVELKKTVIHQCQILGQHLGAGRSSSKIAEEGKMVDTYGKEKERRKKHRVVLLKGGVDYTNLENMEALYASIIL